jgi:hypothetical protein
MSHFFRRAAILAALCVCFPALPARAVVAPISDPIPAGAALFQKVDETAARDIPEGIAVVRTRPVAIRFDALRTLEPGRGRLDLNLFDDTHLTALVDRVEAHGANSISYGGRLAEDPNGSFALVVHGAALAGFVRTDRGSLYEIGTLEGDVHYIHQIAPDSLPPCGTTPA